MLKDSQILTDAQRRLIGNRNISMAPKMPQERR